MVLGIVGVDVGMCWGGVNHAWHSTCTEAVLICAVSDQLCCVIR